MIKQSMLKGVIATCSWGKVLQQFDLLPRLMFTHDGTFSGLYPHLKLSPKILLWPPNKYVSAGHFAQKHSNVNMAWPALSVPCAKLGQQAWLGESMPIRQAWSPEPAREIVSMDFEAILNITSSRHIPSCPSRISGRVVTDSCF